MLYRRPLSGQRRLDWIINIHTLFFQMIFKVKVCQMTGGSVGRERERELWSDIWWWNCRSWTIDVDILCLVDFVGDGNLVCLRGIRLDWALSRSDFPSLESWIKESSSSTDSPCTFRASQGSDTAPLSYCIYLVSRLLELHWVTILKVVEARKSSGYLSSSLPWILPYLENFGE